MKKILWIVDVAGWAYHNRAVAIAKELPGYEHVFLIYPVDGFDLFALMDADLIVCPDPRVLVYYPNVYTGPTVLIANAPKLFRINPDEVCSLERQ